MSESGSDKQLTDLFTKGSHHINLSIIYILHNIFPKGKESRTISLNAHFIFLLKILVTHLKSKLWADKSILTS